MSINVYGIKKGSKTLKNNVKNPKTKCGEYSIIIIKVCERERADHFDLLLISDNNGKQHYCLITDLSRLLSPQINACDHSMLICRRCFTSYRKSPDAEKRLFEHREKCNKNKPVTPIMSEPGTFIKFKNLSHTVRHLITIYADFECLLKKPVQTDEKHSATKIIVHKVHKK